MSKVMGLQEAKNLKVDVESAIDKLVDEFSNQTGLSIQHIELRPMESTIGGVVEHRYVTTLHVAL